MSQPNKDIVVVVVPVTEVIFVAVFVVIISHRHQIPIFKVRVSNR